MSKIEMNIKKGGLSPVIATVLLISIALILAIIIFLWARQFVGEKIEKFNEPIENACDDVNFDAEAVGGSENKVYIVNKGNVPLYGIEIRKIGTGTIEDVGAFQTTIKNGESGNVEIPSLSSELAGSSEVTVVPMLVGETKSGRRAYTCNDNGINVPITF